MIKKDDALSLIKGGAQLFKSGGSDYLVVSNGNGIGHVKASDIASLMKARKLKFSEGFIVAS